MVRWLKALPLALAIAALSIIAISCSSSNSAQVRFVHAIQDASALDIEVNGTKVFTDVGFTEFQPAPPAYTSVPSGSDTVEGLATGSTTEAFSNSPVSLAAGTQYTMVATGFVTSASSVVIMPLADNNTAPANGSVNFRVINASPNGPSAVDVYIVPNPPQGLGSKTFSGLSYNDPSAYTYVTLPYNSSIPSGQPNYTMFVTTTGGGNQIFSQTITAVSASAGAIRTLVLTDRADGTSMNDGAIVLNDLN